MKKILRPINCARKYALGLFLRYVDWTILCSEAPTPTTCFVPEERVYFAMEKIAEVLFYTSLQFLFLSLHFIFSSLPVPLSTITYIFSLSLLLFFPFISTIIPFSLFPFSPSLSSFYFNHNSFFSFPFLSFSFFLLFQP